MAIPAFDRVASAYDATRGGEPRGAAYARELFPRLIPGRSLEVGIGTGVVALGLQRLGAQVIGLDISEAMLGAAQQRLPGRLVRGDASRLPFARPVFDNVYAVWVLHAVPDPAQVVAEMARVVKRGGRCVICPTNRPAPDDKIGRALDELLARVEALRPRRTTWSGLSVTAERILDWGQDCGLTGQVEPLARQSWETTAAHESDQIRNKVWSAMHELTEDELFAASLPTLRFLRELPDGPIERRALAEIVVFDK